MNKPIKILFLTTWLMRGGAQLQLLNFIKVLPFKLNSLVVTVKEEGPLAEEFHKAGIAVKALNFKHKISPSGFYRLVRLIRDQQIDVVFTIGYGDSLFWGRLAAIFTGIRVIYSSLNSLPDVGGKFVLGNRLLNRFNTRFFPVSSVMLNYLTIENNIPAHKITPMGSGVDKKAVLSTDGKLASRSLIEMCQSITGKVILIQVASLNYFKNQLQTLRVALTLKKQHGITNFHVVFAGEGPDRPQLEKFVKENDLTNEISFPGYLPHRTCLDLIYNADIVILPSLSEGFPNILLESAVLKKPLIASDVGGIKDIIIHGESGYLITPEDDRIFAKYLLELMKDKALREKFGQVGYKHVVANYTLKKKVENFLAVLDKDLAHVAGSKRQGT